LVSAVPIALIANVTRITVTGVLHVSVGGEIAHAVFHDWAGWFMMPLALGLFGAFSGSPRLFMEPEEKNSRHWSRLGFPPSHDRLRQRRPPGAAAHRSGSCA
jgi:hypothetical protein